jgi:hypothetical protein
MKHKFIINGQELSLLSWSFDEAVSKVDITRVGKLIPESIYVGHSFHFEALTEGGEIVRGAFKLVEITDDGTFILEHSKSLPDTVGDEQS